MSLELKRKEVELMRVHVARQELELKIAERQEEISRLENHILTQLAAEERLKEEIKQLNEKGDN